jgi:hypothetical protein
MSWVENPRAGSSGGGGAGGGPGIGFIWYNVIEEDWIPDAALGGGGEWDFKVDGATSPSGWQCFDPSTYSIAKILNTGKLRLQQTVSPVGNPLIRKDFPLSVPTPACPHFMNRWRFDPTASVGIGNDTRIILGGANDGAGSYWYLDYRRLAGVSDLFRLWHLMNQDVIDQMVAGRAGQWDNQVVDLFAQCSPGRLLAYSNHGGVGAMQESVHESSSGNLYGQGRWFEDFTTNNFRVSIQLARQGSGTFDVTIEKVELLLW